MTLDYNDFLEFTTISECHYCGAFIFWQRYGNRHNKGRRTNLDRKDNADGYTKENCVVCCKECNYGKSNQFTYGEWTCMARALKEYRNERARNAEISDRSCSSFGK